MNEVNLRSHCSIRTLNEIKLQRLILATSFLPNKQEPRASRKTYKPNAAYARVRQEAAAWIRRESKFPIADRSHAGQDWSSKEGHRADALALRADERRDKLR